MGEQPDSARREGGDLPLQERVADRVAGWFAQADEFRRAHPRLMQRLIDAHHAGESLDELAVTHAKAYAPFDSAAGLQLLLTRAGAAVPTQEVDELASFALTQASRVQVLRAGVALRRARENG